MTKNDLINDFNFRQKCGEYGLYWENAEIYGNVILINTPIEGLYVIFDKKYNTIGVEKNEYQDEKQFINDFYKRYSEFTDLLPFGESFDYPFQNYTLKNFIDLANRIDILESNHGHSISTKINGEWYNRSSQENEEYFQLLSYVKFISEEIKMYFLQNYHMQAMGYEMPDVYSYVRALIKNINASINYQIENNQRPWPADILSSIGQNNRKLNFDDMLYDIADLLMKQNGVKVKSGSPDSLIEIDSSINKADLSILSDKLLKILDLSDEDLKEKEKNKHNQFVQDQVEALSAWITEDIDDELEHGPVLQKKKNNNN